MTAARSDLMALKNEADRIVKCGVTDFPVYQAIELLEEVSGTIDHLAAASQPDREAVKEFIASASFASRSSLDSDTIFCEIYTPGYQPAKKGSFGFFVKELRAILSLLSGASTKSDGVEGHADPQGSGPVKPAPIADSSEAGRGERVLPGETRIYEAGKGGMPHAALSAPVGEPVAWQFMASDDVVLSTTADKRVVKQWEQSGYHVRPLYTYPPAPAVGADVREALGESSQTLEYLRREARTWGKIFSVNVDHVLDKNRKALSALTRPLGGFVQGSIARKQSTDSALQAQGDER